MCDLKRLAAFRHCSGGTVALEIARSEIGTFFQ
jgi:hypothetical protein